MSEHKIIDPFKLRDAVLAGKYAGPDNANVRAFAKSWYEFWMGKGSWRDE